MDRRKVFDRELVRPLGRPEPQLLAAAGRYRELYDTQYRFEQDRFINPGEDFTPEPEKVEVPKARTGSPTRL